jgi:voltage-gated potassium channel
LPRLEIVHMHWRQLPTGRVTHSLEWAIIVLALLVVPIVLIEESDLSHGWGLAAAIGNWLVWLGFAAELSFVMTIARRKRAALRAHWLDAAIVVLTMPFLPSLLAFLRLARLLRLLRVLRLAMLGTRALGAAHVLATRKGFRYVALATMLLVIVAGAAISIADAEEFSNVGVGIWWAVTTITTVGYGDVVPQTVGGRLIAGALMFVGIGFVATLTATIASTFIAHDVQDETPEGGLGEILATLRRIEGRLEDLEAQG